MSVAITNTVILVGLASAGYGFWLAWPPLGYIVGGLSAIGLAVLIGGGKGPRT